MSDADIQNPLEERIHRSLSNVDEDERDIFENFEDLQDNTATTASSLSLQSSTSSTSSASRNSLKYQEGEVEDWDDGVDTKDETIFDASETNDNQDNNNGNTNQASAYVKSKIQELSTVQEQVETTKDNPNILTALASVLDALRKQIESAYDTSKIDANDHATLLERLHSVSELIASK